MGEEECIGCGEARCALLPKVVTSGYLVGMCGESLCRGWESELETKKEGSESPPRIER